VEIGGYTFENTTVGKVAYIMEHIRMGLFTEVENK
jgi:hypothetical protein